MRTPSLLVAAPGSSSGKTTVSLLLAALARQRGLDLRAFKAGPDFIDPQYLNALSGSPVPSLDPWFLGPAALRRHYARYAQGADLVLVEGVMGLFDGKRDSAFGRHSSAELARTLGLPVLLVLNARKAGPTLATQALGLMQADRRLRYAGVVLNQCMGPKSVVLIAPALKKLTGLPVLGWLPPMKDLALPERHLGLTAPSEMRVWEQCLQRALPEAAKTLDFDAILRAAKRLSPHGGSASIRRLSPVVASKPSFKIAVALDEAFHFYYPENLALLEQQGAELCFFSPLRSRALPQGVRGLLIGGGFPESFGARLSKNAGLRGRVKAQLKAGLPVWAECGGLMWLCRSLIDAKGKAHAMVGALPASVRMTGKLQHFGYTQMRARPGHPFLAAGRRLKGHEFHHSVMEAAGPLRASADLEQSGRPSRAEAWRLPGGIATYFHAYWPSQPASVQAFARACQAWSPR
jgi:cobyrinic acid a,c-diamide synthase